MGQDATQGSVQGQDLKPHIASAHDMMSTTSIFLRGKNLELTSRRAANSLIWPRPFQVKYQFGKGFELYGGLLGTLGDLF